MLQVILPIDGGATDVALVPDPLCQAGHVLIANQASVISPGTEKATIALARQSLAGKARERPDHVRRVLEKVRQEGVLNTVRQVRARLAQPMPMGYSSAGVVLEVGEGVTECRVGDRVASNGPHAGVVCVGKNLVARVPDSVSFEQAAYAVLGSIALQGVRLASVGLGDVVAVIGLGLIGQMTVALLKAAGCRVVATDLSASRSGLARTMGADVAGGARECADALRPLAPAGADAVIITAATRSSGPLELAAKWARDKARVVAVGAVGLEVPRREFYHKELELVVSRSYGPGRYDPEYEERGIDYPISYVRWTEQRNIQAVLDQMAEGKLNVEPLTSHQFPIDQAREAYRVIEEEKDSCLGLLLTYPLVPIRRRVELDSLTTQQGKSERHAAQAAGKIGLSVVGAGGFASSTLVPHFIKNRRVAARGLISARGLSAKSIGVRNGFAFVGTGLQEVLTDEATAAIALATRHHLHVPQGLDILAAGKHLFLEKPLAISHDQLDQWVEGTAQLGQSSPVWMIGFNRRFSPAARMLREIFRSISDPKNVLIRFNAGAIPASHWVHDPDVGGGRLVGEACHAVDLATYLIGSLPSRVWCQGVVTPASLEDNVAMTLQFEDGSVATILYTSAGDRSAGKELVEMHAGGTSGWIDDFRKVMVQRDGKVIARKRWWSQEKGYREEIAAFVNSIERGEMPISAIEMIRVTAATLRAVQSLRLQSPLEVDAA